MLAVLAFVAFTIAAILAFAHVNGLSIIGVIACGLALLALHQVFAIALPWGRAQ